MNRDYITRHSENLGRDMNVIVYGNAGYPMIAFPTQDSPCTNYEDFGMVDNLADYIEQGRIQLVCVDSVDKDSWSKLGGDKLWRADVQEAYYHYVCDELVPFVHEVNHSDLRPLTTGCSMGATHAVIVSLRRPDLFEGCIALSGVYDASYFFGDWMNGTLYANSPVHFLPNMSPSHPYVDLYNKRTLIICVGQGAWEDEGIRDAHILDDAFHRLGVHAWCDFWGYDVNHDWPWWKKQIRYFLPIVLEDAAKQEE